MALAAWVALMNESREWRMTAHRGWGDHIGMFDQPKNGIARFEGHTTPRVKQGDIIIAPTANGDARFRVTDVKTFMDPPDQWIATAEREN